ncbi:hypothetical protein CCHL11_00523 [Colletotrichum chlorophyti]|uniref:Uncharacterized protein n=1 Tax=Colletotrichum chlorophyti TaxID=708187 RepID=A0A1Q8RVE1_9PEZI|nr:hypothetical protein CCHL11_00523 [Colletotrichum chlorophyti]
MFFFPLDLAQKGLSLYSVPAAFVMALLPNVYATASAGKNYDPANPRKLQDAVAAEDKIDKIVKARIFRAQAATQNAFETLGLFAASVVAANAAGVDARTTNVLALGYLGCRALYNVIYVRLQDNRNVAPLRSLVWTTSIGIIFTLYVKAASKLSSF